MLSLHQNDVSKDFVAMIYRLPMSVLPQYLQMSTHEEVFCIAGQCLGFIYDEKGNELNDIPDLNINYSFGGAYYLPTNAAMLPSAPVNVATVLHEYAHYLDGFFHPIPKYPDLTHLGGIDTSGFYMINYDLNDPCSFDECHPYEDSCFRMRSTNPMDWISWYGFKAGGYLNCPEGYSNAVEEFAEAFAMYVTAGRQFRAAAYQNGFIAEKYQWLKQNVFVGMEYDTDLIQGGNSGCNDVDCWKDQLPGYMSCSEDYIWDGELRVLEITPPEVSIVFPSANQALQDGVTFQAKALDFSGIYTVSFSLREPDGGEGIPIGYDDLEASYSNTSGYWEYPFDTTTLQDGYYRIIAKATDNAGNEGTSSAVPFSIRNWAVIQQLPFTPNSKAGRTMPVKFSLRVARSVDPAQPFVYNEDLEIRIYRCDNTSCSSKTLMQTSVYGTKSTDYRIDVTAQLYQTNFQTTKIPAQYRVEIWRPINNFMVGSFTFKTVK
jgi:hypothetical protein